MLPYEQIILKLQSRISNIRKQLQYDDLSTFYTRHESGQIQGLEFAIAEIKLALLREAPGTLPDVPSPR